VALYVHYNPAGEVSAMVRRQLAAYRAAGFAPLFISNAPRLSPAAWEAARAEAALVVHRRNGGMDFGAWQDLAPLAARQWPAAEELLLANDSVLGPIRPLEPIFAALRAAGEGVFGLTESAQGGRHLQSYFVLARGRAAVAALFEFLAGLRLSSSKWLVVQRGEIGLTRHMQARDIRVAALFGYARALEAATADAAERDFLLGLSPRFAAADSAEALQQLLLRWPLNPTHALWRSLVRQLGFPFIKTELVRRNPGRLPGVEDWRRLCAEPQQVALLEEHLRLMGQAPKG
jgi:lipopolysaccharide biosynthesis protein